MKIIFNYLKLCSKYKNLFCLLILLQLLFSLISLSSPEVLRMCTRVIETGQFGALPRIIWYALGTTFLFILLQYYTFVLEQKLMNSCEEHVQTLLLSKVFSLKKLRFMEISNGEVVAKITQNAVDATKGTIRTIYNTCEGIFVIMIGLIYMSMLSFKLMLCVVSFNIIFRMVTKVYDQKIRAASKKGVGIKNRNTSFVVDLLNSTLIVKIFSKYHYFQKRFTEYEEEAVKNEVKGFALQNSYDELLWLTKKLAEVIILYWFGGLLVSKGQIDFSIIIAFTVASDFFTKGISSLLWGISTKNSTIPKIDAITKFLEDSNTESGKEASPSKDKYPIRFENVSFGFGEKQILKNVSFTINPGEWVEIKGPNGEGKSTLLNLVLGFYRPDSGRIYFGEQDTTDIHIDSLSKQYGYISQSSNVVEGTINDNIALSAPKDENNCYEILESLNLSEVKERNPINLSQGEKQRLSIGRALYHMAERPIILGDEIFANIDKENQKSIVKVLEKACEGKTALFVCHEDMGIAFDKTIVVDNKTAYVTESGCRV
jgi:ABC-type bacteriocin/lantibiotic exporter with double-glycine peptidase domain